jgi:hypothetical protein
MKQRWGSSPQKSPYHVLGSPVASIAVKDEQYSALAAAFISHEDGKKFDTRFKALYAKRRFAGIFNSIATTIEQIAAKPVLRKDITSERMAAIYKGVIGAHSQEIVEFYRFRRRYENAMLRGNYEDALQAIDFCKARVGESFWYVRAMLALLAKQGKFEEVEIFSSRCKERSNSEFLTFLLRFTLLLASDPALHFKNIVTRTIKELDEAHLSDWAGLLNLLFAPRPLASTTDELKGFSCIQVFPAVDQVYLLESFVTEAIASHGSDGDPFQFQKIFRNLKNAAYGDTIQHSEAILDRLTVLYEEDQFPELVSLLVSEFDSLETPFAALNLVAKSVANNPSRVGPFPLGVWGALSNTLTQIYRLESSPAKLEEDFLSAAISLHSFSGAQHLQLAIFKALPNRFPRTQAMWLARVAQASSVGTVLTRELAEGADPILSHEYLGGQENLPNQRRIKHRIRQLWSNDNIDGISEHLLEYKDATPLPKDYVELVSTFYLLTEQYTELVQFSAEILSVNPQMYVALPIREVVSHSEENQLSNLAALVVFYIYAKRVDSQKDYLLNEAYEEYLLSNGVTRPSELMSTIEKISPLEVVFFRDISALDTMDYLGCFDDSNELRSERVKILDFLRDKLVISAEAHREEVDEIIGQVVVDAGAAEFNINKIEVNTAPIKRDLVPDITSMLVLYQSLDVESYSAKRVITVEADPEGGEGEKLRAVVAGDRNTALLRMLLLIRDRFLFDEKHGLDKNLSTEIRHGFFANLMRSRLEEHKLITEIDDSGCYKPNLYWREANAIVVSDILDEIDKHLAWFSDAFNRLVSQADEWMKVSRQPTDGRLFNFELYLTDFTRYHILAQKHDAEEFIDICLDALWGRVDQCLAEMREKLNVSFKDSINQLFEDLLGRVQQSRQSLPLTDLTGAIVQVKNDIREDITTVSEWFKRSESGATISRTVEALVKISVECFYGVRGAYLDFNADIESELNNVLIHGSHAKSFIVVLVNLLENACRGSGFGLSTQIEFYGSMQEASWSLSVRNPLSQERLSFYTNEYLQELDDRMRSPFSIPLMRKEGGTGLTKVFNQLRLIDDHFDVKLSAVLGTFEVRIIYAT